MSRHKPGRYSLSQEFFPETKLVIIPEENASSNNQQLDVSKQSNEEKQETNENEPQKRRTVLDLVKANEVRLQQINREKQELERRIALRAKNRELWKERFEQLKLKMKLNKEPVKELNTFYKNNKIGLEDIGVYSSKELGDYLKTEESDNSCLLDVQSNDDKKKKKFINEESPVNFPMNEIISPIHPPNYTKVPPIKGIPKTQHQTQSPFFQQSQDQPLTKSQIINYQQNIISSINAMSVPQYTLSSNLINDPSFLDVICINCYEIVKYNRMDEHSEKCISSPIEESITIEKENTFDDCNSRMYKMYSSLKERSEEYLNAINPNLVLFYKALVKVIYQILINNNSIEEIDESSLALNELLNTSLVKITGKERAVLDIFCRRVVQLIYIKTIEMRKIFSMQSEGKENKETNQTSSEDIVMQKEIVQTDPRVSSHARIFSAHALSEIYSDIEDRKEEEENEEDSALSSQGSFFQNTVSLY